MPLDVDRVSLYRGKVNLWVEDGLTRAYLKELWNDPAIAFFIGGGNEGVRAVLEDAEAAGLPNVFALIDRDFRVSNKAAWFEAQRTFRLFVPPVHEIENYLLDVEAIRSSPYHNRGLSAAEIAALLEAAAGRLCWWAACRGVLAELKRRFREGFIRDPSQAISDGPSALRHICGSEWFKKLDEEAKRSTESDIDRLLSDAHQISTGRLSDGTWRVEFSGKEILRDVSSRFCDRPRIKKFPSKESEFFEDLAKEIAAWQTSNDRVPTDLADLREALKARVALLSSK